MTTSMAVPRGLVSADDLDRGQVDDLLTRAESLEGVRDSRLAGRIMATLFFEPSTRTRLSFESAMLRLGGGVLTSAGETSSAAKGETLEDTVRIVAGYSDVIVVRHPEEGAAARAAGASPVPVINAGDGSGEHPTQALTDAYTLRRRRGSLEDLHIAVVGDLRHGRTVHSLLRLLSLYPGVRVETVAAGDLAIPSELAAELGARGLRLESRPGMRELSRGLDAVYMTRVQTERITGEAVAPPVLTREILEMLGPTTAILHPLPRRAEIPVAVDSDPRAAYFEQAANGIPVRMALLDWVLT